MPEDLFDETPSFSLYRSDFVALGAFIGGPIVAGYMIAENFKRIGKPSGALPSWLISIAATFALVWMSFEPIMARVPGFIIPFFYSLLSRILVEKFQGAEIAAHREAGGHLFSAWRSVGVGFIGLLATAMVMLIAMMIIDPEALREM